MKKRVLLFLIIMLLPTFVSAGSSDDDGVSGATQITATCIYGNTSNISENGITQTKYSYNVFEFSGISSVVGGPYAAIKSYYTYDQKNNTETFKVDSFDGNDYIINHMHDYGVKFSIDAFMTTQFADYSTDEETLQKAADDGKFCPSNVYEIDKGNEKEYMFCNGYNSYLEVETCELVREYLNENYSNYSISNQTLKSTASISNIGQDDMTQTDVKDTFVEIEKEKEDACDETSSSYDPEKCNILGTASDAILDQAEDQGITKEEMYKYKELEVSPISPSIGTCDSLLGSTSCPSGQNCEPAFYIQVIFNVMKYVAIILLIVMSILDFLGAVGSSDDGAMKKAANKCIVRLILCVLIFLLPTVLEFIFTFMKMYTTSTCGIK